MQYGPKAYWSIPYVSVAFFPRLKQNFIAYRSSKVTDCILNFPSSYNQALVGCIPSAAVAVHLNLKSLKLVSHLIRCIGITYWIYDNFKCPYKKSVETYRMHLVNQM